MANDTELERKNLQVFCGSAGDQQTSIFGTMKNPDPDYSKDPEELQGTNWPQGWQNAVAADDAPFMEDMNSLFYVLSYMTKYLYQHGIPEWSNKETYTASKSVVLRNGKFYLAKQTTGADNPQDPATDASFTYWYLALDPVNPPADQNWVKGYAQSLANLSQTIDSATEKYPSNKAVLNELNRRKLIAYEKGSSIVVNGNTTVVLTDLDQNKDLVINNSGNVTLDITKLTFPQQWFTCYFKLLFNSGFKPITLDIKGLNQSSPVVWMNGNVADFSDAKAHWIAFRTWSGKTYGLWSDMGTEG